MADTTGADTTGADTTGNGTSAGDELEAARHSFAHEARQGLNAIRLTTGNLRARLGGALDGEQAAYLLAKLDKIDRQIDRLSDLLAPRD